MNSKEKFLEILNNISYIIKNNLIPISNFSNEKKIDEYQFETKEIKKVEEKIIRPILTGDKNFSCKLCPNKLTAIKTFEYKGNLPVLILHYSGEARKNFSPFTKTKSNLIFKNEKLEDLFDRLCKKAANKNMRDFYFQEFPACSFSPNNSSDSDWTSRINFCKSHVIETLELNQIKTILFIGITAVLFYGKEKANELTGKIIDVEFGGKKYPSMVLRSPEGILSLEDKRKNLENKKNSLEYEQAKKEEDKVKKETLDNFTEFCKLI